MGNIPNNFQNCTIVVIPGQACGLHNRVSMSEPEQLNPLFCGGGLSQTRVLYCVPFSQVKVHCVQLAHVDQLSFTGETKKKKTREISFIKRNLFDLLFDVFNHGPNRYFATNCY